MNSDAQTLIARLNAMITLIDNFPMSILQTMNSRTYNSVFDLIIDILAAVGIDVIDLSTAIINDIFSIKMSAKESMMEKVSQMSDDISSEFLASLEDSSKSIIMNILTGIFTCSAIPIIPNTDLDSWKPISPIGYNGLLIPIKFIDYTNMLLISPLSDLGKNYYSLGTDNVKNLNTVYRAYDMNAFLWYVVNRGSEYNQIEINKQMWDSRRNAIQNNFTPDSDEMDIWINSKRQSSQTNPLSKLTFGDSKKDEVYYPILQCNNLYNYEDYINVSFPCQRYSYNEDGTKKNLNDTLYKFNTDYLNSIQIFNPKVILSYMIESLFNFKLSSIMSINIESSILESKIDEIITNIIEADDTTISDCYYAFSNDEYNKMLNQTIYQRYTAKKYNSEKNPSTSFDVDSIISKLDEINSSSTSVEKTSKITRLINEITLTPEDERDTNVGISVNLNRNWWREMIRAIALPIAKSLFTPQVMLLFAINLKELGLVSFDNKNTSDNDIFNFIVNKIMAMVTSIIKFIIDKLIEIMLKFLRDKILPTINNYILLNNLERYEYWISLLSEAVSSCALINISGNKYGGIDEVNYADIVEEKTEPNNTNQC